MEYKKILDDAEAAYAAAYEANDAAVDADEVWKALKAVADEAWKASCDCAACAAHDAANDAEKQIDKILENK